MKSIIKIRDLMKSIIITSLILDLFCGNSLYGKVSPKKLPSAGKFVLTEKIGADLIKVSIYLKPLKISKTSFPLFEARENNCTYSRIPCSLVLNMTIELNGKHVRVDRTSFADLSDLNEAELKQNDSKFVLILNGGDASESYIVKIEFDSKRVLSRELFSAIEPVALMQRIQFFESEL